MTALVNGCRVVRNELKVIGFLFSSGGNLRRQTDCSLGRQRMKKSFLTLGLVATAAFVSNGQDLQTSTTRSASDYLDNRFGAGVILGEPTGLSLKYWLNETLAVDGGLGGSFHHEDGVQLHSDVLWHAFDLFSVPSGRLPLYFGAGGRLKFQDGDDRFGIRFPVGVSYMFDHRPIDIFFEVAPILDVAPSVRGDFNVGVGARFWF